MHCLCHAGVFSKHKGTADGGERCSLATSQKRGNVDVSTLGGRCNESKEPPLLADIHPLGLPVCPARNVASRVWQGLVLKCAEGRSLVLHDELVCKPTERGCGLGMALPSCPAEQVMLLMTV